jgi:hypothetical protein
MALQQHTMSESGTITASGSTPSVIMPVPGHIGAAVRWGGGAHLAELLENSWLNTCCWQGLGWMWHCH